MTFKQTLYLLKTAVKGLLAAATVHIERVLAFLNAIPTDKVAHALAGSVLASLVLVILLVAGAEQPITGTFTLVFGFGMGKELYDRLNNAKHTPDVWDAVATSLGSLTVLLPAALL